jgi:hypothetical protein
MITRCARMIFSAYRRDEFADPDGFVMQLGAVLEKYEDAVIQYVCDPRTGIQRRCKFPPSIAEMVEACEAEATSIETRRRYAAIPKPEMKRLPAPTTKTPGAWANVLIHPSDARHGKLLARTTAAGTDPRDWKVDERGLHVALNWLEGHGATVKQPFQVLTEEDLRRMYPARTATVANDSEEFFVKQSEEAF